LSVDLSWLHSVFWAAWLPGMLFCWVRSGLRGQSWRRFLLESFLVGFTGAGAAWLSFTLIGGLLNWGAWEEALFGGALYRYPDVPNPFSMLGVRLCSIPALLLPAFGKLPMSG